MSRLATYYKFGPFSFDSARQELLQRGRRVRLSVSLLKLLMLFLDRPGEIVSREQIAGVLWEDQGTIDIDTGINTAMRRLRAILEDDPSSPKYIETAIGLGYRFIAEIGEVEEAGNGAVSAARDQLTAAIAESTNGREGGDSAPSGGLQVSQEATFGPGPQIPVRSRFLWIAGTVAGVALLVAGVGIASSRHRAAQAAAAQQAPAFNREPAQITFNSEDNRITAEAVSPDGRLVAYTDRFGISLHSMQDGNDVLGLAPPSFVARRISWRPDMRGLAASGVDRASGRSVVWNIWLGSVPQLLLNDAGQATVSPDGRLIAYTRMQDTEIWISDSSGQNSRLGLPRVNGESVAGLLWSPKGNRLVFDRVRDVREGNNSTNAATANALPTATYESVDASTGTLIAREQNFQFDSGFMLSDGRFVFAAHVPSEGVKLMVVKTDPDTGRFVSGPRTMTVPPKWNPVSADAAESLSASANGETIGAVLTRKAIDVYWARIQETGPTLSGVTRLTGELGGMPHAWSPNGDAVVFDGFNGENLICRQRLGEAKPETLAKLPQNAAMANYSPDGKWILFAEYAGYPGHAVGIYGIPAGGGEPRKLSTTGNIDEFHCSVSFTGACVMRETVNNREFVFYALDPVQGMGRELARTSWNSTFSGDWTLSPDGATVAMADHDPDHPAFRLIPLGAHRTTPGSTIAVRGFGVVLESTWAADAKGFYVETKTDSGYDLLYVDRAGHAKLLRQSPNLIWGIPSRDGKKLAFPGLTVRSNVWVGRTSP